MAARSDVFIGDLLEALHRLDVRTPEEAHRVMQMLGLDTWAPIEAEAAASAAAAAAPVARAQPTLEAEPDQALPPAATLPAPGAAPDAAEPAQAELQPLPPRTPASLPRWHGVAALPRAQRSAVPPAPPLFAPLKARALVAGLAAAQAPDGSPDLDRLVGQLAQGRLQTPLPQALSWRLSGGLQVLVDEGPAMAPLQADVDWLQARLAKLLPADRISWLRFMGTPLRGCREPGRRGRWAWKPGPPGHATLLVSELGLAPSGPLDPSAGVQEWLTFARRASQHGLALRTLAPWPAPRVPRVLSQALHPIPWDRSTTAGMVRRLVARASQAQGV